MGTRTPIASPHSAMKFHLDLTFRRFEGTTVISKIPETSEESAAIPRASLESERLIRQYRDDVSAHLGVRAPNHLTYGFHISLAYRIFELEDADETGTTGVLFLPRYVRIYQSR